MMSVKQFVRREHKPVSLKARLKRVGALLVLDAVLMGGAALFVGQHTVDATMVTPESPVAPNVTEAEPTKADRLMARYDDVCWDGSEKPLADLPGAAIVRYANGEVEYVKDANNHKVVEAAFNEALANIGYGDVTSDRLDPMAMCL